MEKLKKVIEQYTRWATLTTYTNRIETYLNTDFSQALENAKAILETIGKEICESKGVIIEATASINSILKKAFTAIGYRSDDLVPQISSALATIGQKIGDLRNEIGVTSHGKPLEEIEKRNTKVDEMTREFLIDTTVIVACFLIRTFENENPRITAAGEIQLVYDEQKAFNNFLDDTYGDFEIGSFSYSASEILYNVDYSAYATEQKAFIEEREEGKE